MPERGLKSECCTREETLGLLHGVGRVINPKSKWVLFLITEPVFTFVYLSAFLITIVLPGSDSCSFAHDPDETASFFQSYAVVFVQFLQENYLNTMSTVDDVIIGSDILSLVDVLNSEWRVSLIEASVLLKRFVTVLYFSRIVIWAKSRYRFAFVV